MRRESDPSSLRSSGYGRRLGRQAGDRGLIDLSAVACGRVVADGRLPDAPQELLLQRARRALRRELNRARRRSVEPAASRAPPGRRRTSRNWRTCAWRSAAFRAAAAPGRRSEASRARRAWASEEALEVLRRRLVERPAGIRRAPPTDRESAFSPSRSKRSASASRSQSRACRSGARQVWLPAGMLVPSGSRSPPASARSRARSSRTCSPGSRPRTPADCFARNSP